VIEVEFAATNGTGKVGFAPVVDTFLVIAMLARGCPNLVTSLELEQTNRACFRFEILVSCL
jgi:hypothetical protein